MKHKEGCGWKAWNDKDNERYFGEYGGGMSYNLFELTKEQYDSLDKQINDRGRRLNYHVRWTPSLYVGQRPVRTD